MTFLAERALPAAIFNSNAVPECPGWIRVGQIISWIASQLRAGSVAERRRKAMAIYGMMVGALQLARAVNDRKLSDEMLESAIEGALSLAGET